MTLLEIQEGEWHFSESLVLKRLMSGKELTVGMSNLLLPSFMGCPSALCPWTLPH